MNYILGIAKYILVLQMVSFVSGIFFWIGMMPFHPITFLAGQCAAILLVWFVSAIRISWRLHLIYRDDYHGEQHL